MTSLKLAACLAVAMSVPGDAATIAAMKGVRRVLIVAAPDAASPQLARQRRSLDGWRQGAADRDLQTIELVGGSVVGSDDEAATLRRRFALPATAFAVVLIGKDGNVALRAGTPLSAQRLEGTIDAMPMRKAGQR